MKIGLVILHADAARGGAERYTLDVACALATHGHDVTLLASSFGNIPANVRQVSFALKGSSKVRRYMQFLDQLDAHLTRESYDIVHAMLPVRFCDVYHPHAGLAAAAVAHGHEKHAGAARSIAKIFNRFNPKRQRFASIERALLAGNDRPFVVCLSEYIRREVRTYYTLDEADLVTLFNAVDLARFDPKARPDERADMRKQLSLKPTHVAALMIAQDFERKGLREAILALAKVQNRPLQLMVVGKQDATRYIDLAREVGVADRMIFCGPMDDVYAYYSAADFFVLPTKHDPCSLVVLEALAMGLPVISTKQNGATEVMENGVDGFILEDASRVDELADAMSRLCDSKLRTQMSAACLERRERLSFERHLGELMGIYASALDRRTARMNRFVPSPGTPGEG